MKIVTKEDFKTFVDKLIGDPDLEAVGVKAKGEKFVFDCLDSADELRLDYDVTILPPKKYMLPQNETMIEFDLSQPFSAKKHENGKRRVIIGVHPYDIAAIRQTDSYYLDKDVSESYLRRRKNTLIIGSDVLNVSEKAFFGDMGSGNVKSGYDLFITDLGDHMAIEVGTGDGENLLKHAPNLRDATPEEVEKRDTLRNSANEKAKRGLKVKPNAWHDLLQKNYESPAWKEQSDKCLACGSCTLVCPTCFCYDVNDDIELSLKSGNRVRTWDGCLLRGFTEVAGGEVFREDILDRYRHRFNRKGEYLPDNFGFVACVGCGRCSSQCIPDIADPLNLMNMLSDSAGQPAPEAGQCDVHTVRVQAKDVDLADAKHLHMPEPATIVRAEKVTDKEMFFEIGLDSGKPLGHEPGQFVQVSVFGTGEAPISVSSPPGGNTFELVVRKVGDVTSKLHALKAGEKVGIRGPFGTGFDTGALKGRNLLFIAGGLGIVPMRSLFNHVLNNRADYGDVTIMYGCKMPCEMLFRDEVAAWDKREDLTHLLTVDRCPEGECWEGDIGVITTLIPKAKFDPKNTVAIVVGPPIMYKFVLRELKKLDMPDENIIVSLERRMKCGVGKCGHCQMSGVYVCKEGPVFNYKDLIDNKEAF